MITFSKPYTCNKVKYIDIDGYDGKSYGFNYTLQRDVEYPHGDNWWFICQIRTECTNLEIPVFEKHQYILACPLRELKKFVSKWFEEGEHKNFEQDIFEKYSRKK